MLWQSPVAPGAQLLLLGDQKNLVLYTNHILGTLDFPDTEHWGLPSIFLKIYLEHSLESATELELALMRKWVLSQTRGLRIYNNIFIIRGNPYTVYIESCIKTFISMHVVHTVLDTFFYDTYS